MNDQPKALRLAQALNNRQECEDEAADELRRLSEIENLYRAAMRGRHAMSEELLAVTARRDALLEALRTLLSYANVLEMRLLDADGEHRAMQQARAVIKAVEEGK